MVKKLASDVEVIELIGEDGYLELMVQLIDVIIENNKDQEQYGAYASVVKLSKGDKSFYCWIECTWKIIEDLKEKDQEGMSIGLSNIIVDLKEKDQEGMSIGLSNIIVGDDNLEEIMGCDEVLDRFNELKDQNGFKKII